MIRDDPTGHEVAESAHPPCESGIRRSRVLPSWTALLADTQAAIVASSIVNIMEAQQKKKKNDGSQ